MTQQDDITQRLRDNADLDEAEHGNARVVQMEREAADEIERLRTELSKLRAPVADERASEQTAPGRQYHILKTDPEVFQAVMSGAKTFEIRLNDRGYAVGDVLGLRETKHTGAEMRAGAPLVYTGRECQRFVSRVLTGYGLADGWCCLSFRLPHAGGASAPVAGEAQPVAWFTDDHLTDKSATTWDRTVADRWRAKGWPVRPLVYGDAAPQASEARCSCPSGDGSLRHPCAVHPAGEGVPVAWAIFSPSGNIRYWHHDKANVEEFAAKHGLTVCGVANAGPQSRDAEQIADLVLGHAEGLRVSSLLESGTGFGKDVEHRFQVSNGQDRYGVVIILTALSAQPGAQKEQSDA